MKQYTAPEMKKIVFFSEDIMYKSGTIELPPVPLGIKSSTSPLRDDGAYDLF